MPMEQRSIAVDEELWSRVEARARGEERSSSWVVRDALRRYFVEVEPGRPVRGPHYDENMATIRREEALGRQEFASPEQIERTNDKIEAALEGGKVAKTAEDVQAQLERVTAEARAKRLDAKEQAARECQHTFEFSPVANKRICRDCGTVQR